MVDENVTPSDLDAAAEAYAFGYGDINLTEKDVFGRISAREGFKAGAAWANVQPIAMITDSPFMVENITIDQRFKMQKEIDQLKAEVERQTAIADKEYRLRNAYRTQCEKLYGACDEAATERYQARAEYEAFKKGSAEND